MAHLPVRHIVFWNIGYSGSGLSGGDISWLKLAMSLAEARVSIVVVTSGQGVSAFRRYGLTKAKYVVVPGGRAITSTSLIPTVLELIRRSVVSLVMAKKLGLQKGSVVVCNSDLLHENLPLLAFPKTKDVVIMSTFHLTYPLRRHHPQGLWSR